MIHHKIIGNSSSFTEASYTSCFVFSCLRLANLTLSEAAVLKAAAVMIMVLNQLLCHFARQA